LLIEAPLLVTLTGQSVSTASKRITMNEQQQQQQQQKTGNYENLETCHHHDILTQFMRQA